MLLFETNSVTGDEDMGFYCCKCLVNKVENDGDVCSSCGGNETLQAGDNTSYRAATNAQTSAGNSVNISTRRRIMTGISTNGTQGVNGTQTNSFANQTMNSSMTSVQQPSTSGATPKAIKKKVNAPLQGVIQNFDTGVDERSFVARVADSLFKGISYNGKSNLVMTEFQLYENWNSGYSSTSSTQPVATRVVCYGKIGQGRPVENNDVRVYGVRDKTNNYFIAEQIENTTDGTFASFIPQKMSATVVRLIALVLVAVVFSVISGISFPSISSRTMSVSMYQIVIGVVAMLAGVITFFFGKNSLRPGRKPLLFSIAALLVILGIFVITMQDAEIKIVQLGDALLNVLIYLLAFRLGFSLLLGLGKPNPQVEKILDICFIGLGAIMALYLVLTIFLS